MVNISLLVRFRGAKACNTISGSSTTVGGCRQPNLFGSPMRARHLRRVSSRPSFTGVAEQEIQIVYVNSDMIARFAQRDVGEVGLVLL
jgi:hypothetical protein